MRKVYAKPSFDVELFRSEDILVVSGGAFSQKIVDGVLKLENGTEINIVDGNVLESMDYKSFVKKQ